MKKQFIFIFILFFFSQCLSAQTVYTPDSNNDSTKKVLTLADKMPSFPGGSSEMYKFIGNNIEYPREARELNITGKVYVSFVVNEDGKISDSKIIRGIGYGCDEEVLRVVSIMPKWIPGELDNKVVSVQMTLPVKFNIDTANTIYLVVEKMPEFPGGSDELLKYIHHNIKYPKETVIGEAVGTVYLRFVVDKNGNIINEEITQRLEPWCDEEALRIVRSMPRWIPGEQDGRKVNVRYNLPIRFNLNDPQKDKN